MTINISQLDIALVYALLMLAAGYICFRGYKIYKLALALIGFAVGFTRLQPYLALLGLGEGTMLIAQLLAGLACAALAWHFVRIGIFIAVYHFAQNKLALLLAALLAQKLQLPEILWPVFGAVAGMVIAWLIALLAVKSERPVVVIVTALVGGFAAIEFLLAALERVPEEWKPTATAITALPAMVWLAAKGLLCLSGVLVQRPLNKR
ncbi:MAG: DUF4203 domain-containing protein [Lachnospiraceae bacterium]|nr:DUF4203 domain-containing protein [Lachnospiraceae bacterium]